MLSEVIKKKIEERFGNAIRYPRDCDALAASICTNCNERVSGSTLKRLFGFVKGIDTPRRYTLDLIAKYVGYKDWDVLLSSYNISIKPEIFIGEINPVKLKTGEKYELHYKPGAVISIEYTGRSKFRVLSAKSSQLKQGDVFKATIITLHHPLFIRVNNNMHDLIEGQVSGITSIRKL
ncbi:MAG TPA: hypothetical protein VK783_05140 [Bacteroidia bacterium]|nr:hypothetical protein [Bacteroidia bacterium]